MFVDAGVDVNAANDLGNTAMHYAAQTGANRIVEYLAGKGARLDIKNKQGRTPLDVARGAPTGTPPAMRYATDGGTVRETTAALIKRLMGGSAAAQ